MRIVYISHGNIPSKFANTFQAMKMAEALAAHVDALTLVTAGGILNNRSQTVDLYSWYGVSRAFRIVKLPVYRRSPVIMPSGINRRFLRAAAIYARMKFPQLVYTRSRRAARHCTKMGLKTILETHSSADTLQMQLKQAMERSNLLGIVTVTEFRKNEYAEAGFPEEKIFVWPDAVDMARFANLPDAQTLREKLGMPTQQPLIVYCGHFYENKGVPCLVDAARRMPDVKFCLVGGWPEDIQQMKRRVGAAQNIIFPGFVPNNLVPMYLAAADVLVLPNSAKTDHAKATSPLKLFEYMAACKPVVATRIPALHGFLTDQTNCFLVDPDSPAALAEGIRSAVADLGLARRVAGQAFQEVQAFTWKKRAADILTRFGFPPTVQSPAAGESKKAA